MIILRACIVLLAFSHISEGASYTNVRARLCMILYSESSAYL